MIRSILIIFLALLLSPTWAQTEQSEETESPDDDKKVTYPHYIGPKSGFGLGTVTGDPTVLVGSDRREVVLDRTKRTLPNNFTGHFIHKFTPQQKFLAEVNLSPVFLGTDLSYTVQPKGWDGAFRANWSYSTSEFSPFYEGVPNVSLPNGSDPYLQHMATGLEYVHQFNDKFEMAFGAGYRHFGYSDELFGGNRFNIDRSGTPLVFSGSSGDIYSLSTQGVYSTLDDPYLPKKGTKFRFGLSQSFQLGGQSSSFARLTANLAHYIPAPGFNDGDHTLLLNLQAGTILGTSPQLTGFHLGGASSVRGIEQGGMASGTSFVQGTAEYRHFLTDMNLFGLRGELRGVGFVDYGSVLGTQNDLAGIPPNLLSQPNDALGYGIGLQLAAKKRLYRIESGWAATGGHNLFFVVGERF